MTSEQTTQLSSVIKNRKSSVKYIWTIENYGFFHQPYIVPARKHRFYECESPTFSTDPNSSVKWKLTLRTRYFEPKRALLYVHMTQQPKSIVGVSCKCSLLGANGEEVTNFGLQQDVGNNICFHFTWKIDPEATQTAEAVEPCNPNCEKVPKIKILNEDDYSSDSDDDIGAQIRRKNLSVKEVDFPWLPNDNLSILCELTVIDFHQETLAPRIVETGNI
jgi:hypothetical protein